MGMNGINPNAAIGAYLNSQNINGTGQATTTQVGSNISAGAQNPLAAMDDSPSFSDFLGAKLEQSVQSIKSGEEMSGKAITGQADITDVVQAVTSAELSLKTLVSVRDKMISAYQDVMRMQI